MMRLNGSDGTVPAWQGDHHVVRLEFPALIDRQPEARRKELVRNDAVLNAVLTSLEDGASVSVLFTTTPAHSPVDGARTSSNAGHTKSHLDQNQHPMQVVDFDVEDSADQSLHVAWKRNTDGHIPAHSSTREPSSNETNSNAGLFEKYNYLSAGIYMGIFAFILLFSILLVGMTAVASIQVSEGSFNKEMVNAMTKVQKQQ
ncbi:MAG: hypothetical protein Q9159_001262 [Coniocarpon cinnabarinum]